MRTKVTYTQQMLEAREHIAQIKDFYKHLRIFSIATILIFIIKADIFEWFLNSAAIAPSLKDWITWNIISVPIIWAVVLLIHGWVVFRIKFKTKSVKRLGTK